MLLLVALHPKLLFIPCLPFPDKLSSVYFHLGTGLLGNTNLLSVFQIDFFFTLSRKAQQSHVHALSYAEDIHFLF